MNEKLEVYDLDGQLLYIQDRQEFYNERVKESKQTWSISKKIRTIRLILMNSNGRIYLQKRSRTKSENSGKYDKTVWWHVIAWDSFNMTAIKECAEELWFPATILDTDEFEKAIRVTDLSIIGVFKKIDYINNFQSIRILKDNSNIIQPHMTTIYLGYYNWPIKFIDGESSGIEVFSLEEIQEEISQQPEKFTEDIKYMIQHYESLLIPINKIIW